MSPSTEQVVQWALEAGFSEWRIGTDENRSGLQMHELRRIERLVNLAHEAGRNVGLAEAATVCDENASACAPGLIRDVIESQSTAIHERIKA